MKKSEGQLKTEILQKYKRLEPHTVDTFLSICQYKQLRNKEKLFNNDGVKREFVFILSGVIRGYFTNNEGVEKNIYIKSEGAFSGRIDTLFRPGVSKYTFESILETEVLIFDLKDVEKLIFTHPDILKIYIWGLKENITSALGRVESLVDKLPEQRYVELIKTNPIFFKKTFNKHIANYLGITPVSLSRIIKRQKELKS